jgi:hypothetical protein
MTKLNQIVAVEKGVKSTAYKRFTEIHKNLQKKGLLQGLSRTYSPIADEGDKLPPEESRLQLRADDAVAEAVGELVRLFDVVATKDWGNQDATAHVSVNGEVLLETVPVTTLLFLEKQLNDLRTFVEKIPVLDPSENWDWNENQRCYSTKPVQTQRERKVPKVIEKAPATKEHPAQTDVYMDTEVVGYWTTTKYSGAIPAERQKELLDRVEELQAAVKQARETANMEEVKQVKIGEKVLGWLFR